ncbi:uncharacterized protein LOC126581728 [Anopheles aquasalis]|uniref:uncharacterized protein LOC126581728 n=1 Tax=Anopheles aquasalis TaxID=42839 RepID=UPI00215A5AEC|nr:uncharacterized protein LOC126581728 [Anopheles aquasalis]XP_050101539.1 uncharacterized protein LOC126581728 [Anopheles aquasalis]XP_050101541.1 uncharacterized protein LOC126581728 [Anopheles aquasalis]XP_050101542.1 uncharacterized protein LOC126581728 [Anopheles aquasalis]
MDVPSMVQRSGDQLIVRRVVSGEQVILGNYIKSEQSPEPAVVDDVQPQSRLPQCRVKRNYTCSHCNYCTQNPRDYLTHLRDTHGEKIVINECKRCLYASRHYQKLVRHMKMVHGCNVDAATPSSSTPADRTELPEATQRPFVKREALKPPKGRRSYVRTQKLRDSTLDNSILFQQLVASGLTDLLQAVGDSWSFASADNRSIEDALKVEMDNTRPLDEHANKMRKSMEDVDSSPRKRNRPIPNLIPLAASPPAAAGVRSEKELLKPVPMSTLMPPEPKDQPNQPPVDFPIGLASSRISINLDTHTKCTFCELSYDSTIELANHIATAHKEDLIASLLQKSIDDSKQNVFLQTDTDSASSDMWKTLLESSLCPPESAPKGADGSESSARPSVVDVDDEVEIMENKSETYCGVETAPGYGEVTNTIPAGQPNPPGVMKKVFKCPHCSFWASTASRFHVHIVGHLNKKPFECSLCSYRSNWRWDITKHIRLKTIRDPSHKNAGVLMNDETGRRNYTKYNKYITLMQITDNSVKDTTGSYSKTLGGNAVSDLITACNIDLQAIANMAGFKLLMQDGKQPSEELDSTGQTATSAVELCDLKCQICDYRGTSKEELMLHLANSHIGLGNFALEDIDNSGENEQVVERGSSKPKNCTTSTVSNSGTPTPSTSFSSLSKPTANTSNDSSTNGTLTTSSSGAGERACLTELGDRLGEGDNGSQKVAMPTWRHNAPYRCGHCHQVSNWKHVIQRHCRLKHNGNVFIELTNTEREDGSEIDGHRGGKQGGQTSFYVVDEGSSMSTVPPLAPFSMDEPGYSASSLEPIVEINDKDTADLIGLDNILASTMTLPHDGFSLDHPDNDSSQGGMQLQCVSCDFHAESLNQLTEHLQLHIVNGTPGGQTGVDTDGENIEILAQGTVPTCLYYCPKCPARFFHESHIVLHLEHHEPNDPSQSVEASAVCRICSYRSATEEELEQHSEVHTAQYNKNTTNLQLFLDEHSIYRKPTLALLLRNGEQVLAVDPTTATAAAAPATNGGRSSSVKPSDVASSSRKMKRLKPDHHQHTDRTHRGNTEEKTPAITKPTILLCKYCDNTFDGEVALNAHVRSHFTAVLTPSAVTYYASLNNTLNKENKFELVVSGTQTTMPLRYVYDNGRRKEWSTFSKSESVLLKL